MPPSISNRHRSSCGRRLRIRCSKRRPASRVAKRKSISASAKLGTTLTAEPPLTVPTLTVMPRSLLLIFWSLMIWRLISRMALAPFSGSTPACEAIPVIRRRNVPTPLRKVLALPPGRGGSRHKTAREAVAIVSRIGSPPAEPISSSGIKKKITSRSGRRTWSCIPRHRRRQSRIPLFIS